VGRVQLPQEGRPPVSQEPVALQADRHRKRQWIPRHAVDPDRHLGAAARHEREVVEEEQGHGDRPVDIPTQRGEEGDRGHRPPAPLADAYVDGHAVRVDDMDLEIDPVGPDLEAEPLERAFLHPMEPRPDRVRGGVQAHAGLVIDVDRAVRTVDEHGGAGPVERVVEDLRLDAPAARVVGDVHEHQAPHRRVAQPER
jgi:hypothetical protein